MGEGTRSEGVRHEECGERVPRGGAGAEARLNGGSESGGFHGQAGVSQNAPAKFHPTAVCFYLWAVNWKVFGLTPNWRRKAAAKLLGLL